MGLNLPAHCIEGARTVRIEGARTVRTSWLSGMTYLKWFTPFIGTPGLKEKDAESAVGPIQVSVYALNNRRSRSSVIFPPYCTSPTCSGCQRRMQINVSCCITLVFISYQIDVVTASATQYRTKRGILVNMSRCVRVEDLGQSMEGQKRENFCSQS